MCEHRSSFGWCEVMKTRRVCLSFDWLWCWHGGLGYIMAIGALVLGIIFYFVKVGP